MSDLRIFEKNDREASDFKINQKNRPKPGMEIRRDCGPTPVERGGSGFKAPPLAARPLFLRSYRRYTAAQKHSTCQLRLTQFFSRPKLTGWLASLYLRKPYTYASSGTE